jgi:cytochrome oxidase Cu insertion factor (SCO1/SenC/PrrC family)
MVRTTPPKEDKADTSSVEVPTTQSLVAQQGSKVSDDNLTDDDPELLNFTTVEFEIICQMSSWL